MTIKEIKALEKERDEAERVYVRALVVYAEESDSIAVAADKLGLPFSTFRRLVLANGFGTEKGRPGDKKRRPKNYMGKPAKKAAAKKSKPVAKKAKKGTRKS